MKSICIISFFISLLFGCNSSEKNKNTNKIVPKVENKQIKLKLIPPKSSELPIEDIKGVYKCFMPYKEGEEVEVQGSMAGILLPSTPDTYYEITFDKNKEVICSHREMDGNSLILSQKITAKYEIKSNNNGITELLFVYNPSYGEGPEKIKIILNEKNKSLVYQGHSGTPHKNITLKKTP
jgi:hypothetical protein